MHTYTHRHTYTHAHKHEYTHVRKQEVGATIKDVVSVTWYLVDIDHMPRVAKVRGKITHTHTHEVERDPK